MNTNQELVEVFDTTLRDGLQVEGVSATVDDKLRIAEQLDHLGVHFIEGGWPGANPKDIEFFARAESELTLGTSTLVAFGSTRRPRGKSDDDATLRNLIEANTAAVCIVAKSSEYQVIEAMKTTLDEGVAMIADSVGNQYRESTTRDLYDLARIADNCEHIHMFQRMCVLRDIDNTYEMDLNTTYCCYHFRRDFLTQINILLK